MQFHMWDQQVFCPVEGRTYQIITQTGDVQKYVTLEKDISKETQENDYEVLLQQGIWCFSLSC